MSARATLILLVGAPGSGKSYLGRLLAQRLQAALLQTDALRKQMFKEPSYTSKEHAAVYAESHRRIADHLRRGRSIIFDATNLDERKRQVVYELAEQAVASLVIVLTYAPIGVIRRRLAARQTGADPLDHSEADWSVYRRLRRADPIPRPHLVVNTAIELEQALSLIATRARRESGAEVGSTR